MHIENFKGAVISTAHIPYNEAANLETTNHFFRPEGFMLHTAEPIMNCPATSFALGYMKAQGFDWVLFDRDADTLVGQITTYNW